MHYDQLYFQKGLHTIFQTVHLVLQQIQVNFWHRDERIDCGILKFALKRSRRILAKHGAQYTQKIQGFISVFHFNTAVGQTSILIRPKNGNKMVWYRKSRKSGSRYMSDKSKVWYSFCCSMTLHFNNTDWGISSFGNIDDQSTRVGLEIWNPNPSPFVPSWGSLMDCLHLNHYKTSMMIYYTQVLYPIVIARFHCPTIKILLLNIIITYIYIPRYIHL